MKHPHLGRVAEIYRLNATGKYVFVGYSAGPWTDGRKDTPKEYTHPKDAKWNTDLQAWVVPARIRPIVEE